jgi:hypothetical protein
VFKTYAGVQASAGSGTARPVASPSGGMPGPGGWHPTVLYMLGLVVAEILAAGFLTRHLLG